MASVLNVIQPYWYANCWVFDDASKGLGKESLEGRFEAELREIGLLARLIGGGVTKMIDCLVKDIPNAREGFILLFSSQPFAGYRVELNRIAEENGGCLYRGKNYSVEVWLSPALFRYFETTPGSLYMKAEPQRAEYDPTEMVAAEESIEQLEQTVGKLTLENEALRAPSATEEEDFEMDRQLIARCGAYCGDCEWKEKMNCSGCQAAKGNMFWGECRVAKCSIEKRIEHCGLCSSLPCNILQEAFDNPEHGDNGERLANLKAWARGEDSYIKLGTFSSKNKA